MPSAAFSTLRETRRTVLSKNCASRIDDNDNDDYANNYCGTIELTKDVQLGFKLECHCLGTGGLVIFRFVATRCNKVGQGVPAKVD